MFIWANSVPGQWGKPARCNHFRQNSKAMRTFSYSLSRTPLLHAIGRTLIQHATLTLSPQKSTRIQGLVCAEAAILFRNKGGHSNKYAFGSHQPRSKSRRIHQKDKAISPAQNVSARDRVAKWLHSQFRRRIRWSAYRPQKLAMRSSGANDQFQATKMGLA